MAMAEIRYSRPPFSSLSLTLLMMFSQSCAGDITNGHGGSVCGNEGNDTFVGKY